MLHCTQEIPCDPCSAVCPQELIDIDEEDIRALPHFLGQHLDKTCTGCEKCVTVCPGLAITLVDTRKDAAMPLVTIPYELSEAGPAPGTRPDGAGVRYARAGRWGRARWCG